jgi:hypothetical protein
MKLLNSLTVKGPVQDHYDIKRFEDVEEKED